MDRLPTPEAILSSSLPRPTSNRNLTSIKRESVEAPKRGQRQQSVTADSVAQSLDAYAQTIVERDNRKILTAILGSCPVFLGVSTSFEPPILRDLPRDSRGTPLYLVPSSSKPPALQVDVTAQIAQNISDPVIASCIPIGNDAMKRVMVTTIYKFLLWQCGAIEDLASVTSSTRPLDWEKWPQLVFARGFRVVNIPARALYPNGQESANPRLYPTEVLDDIIKQFSHPSRTRRFGLLAIKHDDKPAPLMMKVCKASLGQGNQLDAVEWCMAGFGPPPQPTIPPLPEPCRCNLCLDDGTASLGLEFVIRPDGSTCDPVVAAAQWNERYLQPAKYISGLRASPLVKIPREPSQPATPLGSLPDGPRVYETLSPASDDDIVPGAFKGGRFIPTFVHANTSDSGSESEFEQDSTSLDADTSSEVSSDSDSDTAPVDTTDAVLSIPSIQHAEALWDVEDFETDRIRAAEDEQVKRKRATEDHVKETSRKRCRVTLEVEYQMQETAKQREAEDHRREEARRREDELVRMQLEQRLASIEG